MFCFIILNKVVVNWKNVLDKGSQGPPQNENEQWGTHYAFKDGQSRPAMTTDTRRELSQGAWAWVYSVVCILACSSMCACEFPSAQLSHP